MQVGDSDGATIKIWNDLWISGVTDVKIANKPLVDTCNVSMVCELIVNGKWQLDPISRWITNDEAEAIRAIPLSSRGRKDKLVWSLNKNSKYTVRSGHALAKSVNLWHNMAPNSSKIISNDLWKAL